MALDPFLKSFNRSQRVRASSKALWIWVLITGVSAQTSAPQLGKWIGSARTAQRAINRGDTDEAQRQIDHILQGTEKPELRDNLLGILSDVAVSYRYRQMYAEAESLCQRVLAIQENAFAPEDRRLLPTLACLAGVYKDRGDYIHAEPLYVRLLAIGEKTFAPPYSELQPTIAELASVYKAEGKYTEAAALWERHLEKQRDTDPTIYWNLDALATAYIDLGKFPEAEKLLTRALSMMDEHQGATVLNDLAKAYIGQGKYSEAEANLRRALSIWEKALGPTGRDSTLTLPFLETYADLLRKTGRNSELVDTEARIQRIRSSERMRVECPSAAKLPLTKPSVDRIVDLGIFPNNVGAAAGAVWIASNGTVIRLDPRNNQVVARIAVNDPQAVAGGEAGVWITGHFTATVLRIDPQTNKVTATVNLPYMPRGVAVENATVWVITHERRLVKINSHTNHIVTQIPFHEGLPPGSPSNMFDLIGISAGEDAVWVLGYSTFSDRAAVFRIDPRTNAITATIPVSSRPWGVAVGEGGVWVASAPDHTGCQGTLSRIDPRTNRVVAKITVGYSPLGVAVGGGSIWVPNSSDGTISRIDPGTNQVVTRIVADSAKGLAFSEQKLWGIDSEFRVREFQLSPLTEQGNAQAQFTRE